MKFILRVIFGLREVPGHDVWVPASWGEKELLTFCAKAMRERETVVFRG